eukprot:scaffold180105_cov24-Attheya_sp.AAC.1
MSKLCGSCNEEKPLADFSTAQRKKCDDATCKACCEKSSVDAPLKLCVSCNEEKPLADFSQAQRKKCDGKCRLCNNKKCSSCHQDMHFTFFNEAQREQDDGTCNECIKQEEQRAQW